MDADAPHGLAVHLDRQHEGGGRVRRHGGEGLRVPAGVGVGERVPHMAGDRGVVGMAGKGGGVFRGPVAEDGRGGFATHTDVA